MLLGGMKESKSSVIEIPDWTYSSYLNMIEFLYSGSVSNFTPTAALELIGLADAYNLDTLKRLCENTLIYSVDTENVCELLVHAHRYGAIELKTFCMNYIIKNFTKVNASPQFERLENVPNLLIEITRAVFSKREC